MNGVDWSDQMLSCHSVSLKCYRWSKTFFHLVDMAVVNGFLLFSKYRQEHPEEEALKRPCSYSSQFLANHVAVASEEGIKRNCFVCYKEGRGEKRVVTY